MNAGKIVLTSSGKLTALRGATHQHAWQARGPFRGPAGSKTKLPTLGHVSAWLRWFPPWCWAPSPAPRLRGNHFNKYELWDYCLTAKLKLNPQSRQKGVRLHWVNYAHMRHMAAYLQTNRQIAFSEMQLVPVHA